jgi:ribosomal-protein-alanine N-acetyltransferase
MIPPIKTERLDLACMTPAFLRASLQGNIHEAEHSLRASLPKDWPGDARSVLALRLKQIEEDFTVQPWLLRAMVLRAHSIVVGHIGFHTPPNPEYLQQFSTGAIEFGFTVFPEFRRRGYAREASLALMQWAHQSHGVSRFILSIRPDNLASQALAAQLGFVRIGSHMDEVDGLEEVLEHRILEMA